MKFSESTLTVLKNYATINPSVIFTPGSTLRTIDPSKTVMATATIEDVIPSEAIIYDISRFLSVHALYREPEIEFGPKSFVVSEGRRKTTYYFADKTTVIAPPAKDLAFPDGDVRVDVAWDDFQSVLKAAGVLQLPEVAFTGEDGKMFLKAFDNSNPTSDTFNIEIGETEDTFQLILKTERLKFLPLDYKITLSTKGISMFEGTNIKYFVAVDQKSTYTKAN